MSLVLALGAPDVLRAQSNDPGILRSQIVEFAKKFLGVPYVYGAASPSGFDCTGIVFYTYQKIAALTIPRATRFLAQFGEKITQEQAFPGDIYIFDTVGGPSHAGLYIGNNQVLHAASAGRTTGVIISSMAETYYATRFLYGRRILPVPVRSTNVPASEPPIPPPLPPGTPDLPLTTLDIPLGRRSLRNYDRIPILQATLVEFEIQQNRSETENFRILLLKGDYEGGNYDKIWEETRVLKPGERWLTRQYRIEGEAPWSLVVLAMDGTERGLRVFRSVEE